MNKLSFFKKLLPGLLPLFVFIIADSVWGTEIGLIVAVAFGIFQLVYTWIREKRFDRFLLFDTLLIVTLGIVSIILENEVFFKLKPALIGLIFCIILGISAFSSNNIMLLMSKRYMKDIVISREQFLQFNRSLRILFFLFSSHTLLVVYSAFYLSKEAWLFISGGLFYILFGIYFVFEMVRNQIKKMQYKKEEWLPLVDGEGKITGQAPRSVCHSTKNMMHPVIHLHIINNGKMIYLQKRTQTKTVQPGKWDISVGGHISVNDTVEQALTREAREELGIENFQAKLIAKYKWETDNETELVFMFLTNYNGIINYNKNEIEDGKYWTNSQIISNLGKNVFTPHFEFEFELLKKRNLV